MQQQQQRGQTGVASFAVDPPSLAPVGFAVPGTSAQHAQAPPPAAIPASPEEAARRRQVVHKLQQYARVFPDTVQPLMRGIDVETLDLQQAETKLSDVKNTVSNRNDEPLSAWGSDVVLQLAEELSKGTFLRLSGPVARLSELSKDRTFTDIVKEILLEYGPGIDYVRPEYRLLMYLLRSGYLMHYANAHMLDQMSTQMAINQDDMASLHAERQAADPNGNNQ